MLFAAVAHVGLVLYVTYAALRSWRVICESTTVDTIRYEMASLSLNLAHGTKTKKIRKN